MVEHLVKVGAPLRKVAECAGVPTALRKVKPGATHHALRGLELFTANPDLIHAHMPQSLPRMRFWLKTVAFAKALSPGVDFAEFVAKNVFWIGTADDEIIAWVENTADWVRACRPQSNSRLFRASGSEFVTRRFSPGMSVRTVNALSEAWHEAVTNARSVPSFAFPVPWAQAAKADDYEILPITDNVELFREGRAMHHCVGTYGAEAVEGKCYIFSLRKDGKKMATIELVRSGDKVELGQIRGRCNGLVAKEIKYAVRKWLKTQKPFLLPDKPGPGQVLGSVERPAPRQIISLAELQISRVEEIAVRGDLIDPGLVVTNEPADAGLAADDYLGDPNLDLDDPGGYDFVSVEELEAESAIAELLLYPDEPYEELIEGSLEERRSAS